MKVELMLDLYCGAGGAAMGYYRAFGPDVRIVGVDHKPQPRYPFEFVQADAMEFMRDGRGDGFDFYHASPPCQRFSVTKSLHDKEYPDLIAPTRHALRMTGKPWVIENVPGAPLENPLTLCGSSFGLGVRRHRLFETCPIIVFRPFCFHHEQDAPLDVTGTGGPCPRHNKPRNVAGARAAMGIDWMTRPELNEAIPPAYTEWIGRHIMEVESA